LGTKKKKATKLHSSPQKNCQKQSNTPDITRHPESHDIENAQVGHFADSALSIIPWSWMSTATMSKPTRASDLLLLCPEPTITPENTPLANCKITRNIENPR